MERTIISFDYAMKTILRDKANFDILSGFLSELLGRDVVVQEILESEGNTDGLASKVNRVDLKAKIDNGEIAVFEIQFADQVDFLGKVIFNACKAIVEQVSRGDYYKIKKVYSINIAYFYMGAQREYLFRARLSGFTGVHYDEHIPFSQHLNPPLSTPSDTSGGIHPEYYLILPLKFDEEIRSRFDEWVYVLKTSKVRASFTAAGVQEAGEKLDMLKMTPEEKAVYVKTLASEMDYKSQLYTAEMKGEQKGLEKGLQEGLQKGLQEGLEKGLQEGERKGEQKILDLLKSGKPPEEIIKSYDWFGG